MPTADLVIRNARIYTVEPTHPWATAIAIRDSHIIAFDADAEAMIGATTRVVDLAGRMVMPGLHDAHTHAFEGARSQLYEIGFAPNLRFDDMLAAVARHAAEPGHRRWITGGQWGPHLAPTLSREAARQALDAVSAGRPVVLRDLSYHSRFANSAALQQAGITADTADPENGTIVRDPATGAPTGLLLEAAGFMMDEIVPPWSATEHRAAALRSVTLYNRLGVTAFQLAVASRTTLLTYKSLDEEGALSAWVGMFIAMAPGLAERRDGIGLPVVAERAALASPHLRVDFAKFFMDGVPAMRTAAFVDPYLPSDAQPDPPRGHSHYTVENLAEQIAALDAQGISVKIHAVGDQATTDTLDAIASVRHRNGPGGPRHQIAHMNFIRDEDIPRLAALNVVADLCPPMWFPSPHMAALEALLGRERVQRSWPIRTMLETGAHATLGTDWPAISPTPSPWPGLAALITRRRPFSDAPAQLGADQSIDVATAIRLATIEPAIVMCMAHRIGSLAVGKSADLIVLDRNLLEIQPDDIASTEVIATIFQGRVVHTTLAALPIEQEAAR